MRESRETLPGTSPVRGVSAVAADSPDVVDEEVTMKQEQKSSDRTAGTSSSMTPNGVVGCWGVRYQVSDVARSVDFYERQLGFKAEAKHLTAFAQNVR
jgi:hypothetical protein